MGVSLFWVEFSDECIQAILEHALMPLLLDLAHELEVTGIKMAVKVEGVFIL